MIACPNKSSKEWIAMVDKLGEFESYRAYARKGDLLTKEELDLAYLPGQGIRFLEANGVVGTTTVQAIPELNIGADRKAVVSATTIKLLDNLREKLGVDYEIIGGDTAIELTKNTTNPWSGEKAFFIGGKVYLLEGAFGAEDALHEFIHPLVRAIKNENRALFDRLAAEAFADTEVATTVEELYGEDLEDLKSEEAIVRAVQKSVRVEDFQSKEGFVQKVLYAIKQMFRKLFGRNVKVERLSLDTKIADLAEMLKSESFQIDTDSISEEEYVAYLRANDLKIKEELENQVTNNALVQTVEDTFQMVTSQIRSINRNSKQKFIKELLAEEGGRGLLQGVKDSLKSVAGLDSVIEDAKTDAEVTSRRATQFVIALRKVEAMMKLIDSEIAELSKLDTQESFQKIHYLDNLTNSWNQLLTHASDILNDGGLKSTSELAGLIDTIKGLVERSQKNIVNVYTEASADMLWDTLKLVSENITNKLQGELRKAIDAKAPASKIKKIKSDIEKFSFDRNKIKAVLQGREGDTNAFSAFLESYINNPDVVVGGFAKYLKDNLTDVQIKAQSRVNEMGTQLESVLKAAGYNANNPGELMKLLTFVDKKSRVNDKGEIEEYEVIKLLNQFKNYESDRIRLNFEYEQLIKEGKNKEAREKKKEIQQWEKNYMNREYVDEFYEKNKIYDDAGDIGAEAKYEREKVLEDINNERDAMEASKESVDEDSQVRLKALQSEYSNLFSLRYADGSKKAGRDLEKAQLHRRYREESSKFYEQTQMTGMFEGALNDYLDGLIANGMKPGSPELEQKRLDWLEDNTRYAVDPEYYDRKQAASAEISKILSKYPGSAELSKEVSDTYNDIVDLVSGFKDEDGQIVGTDMSDSRITEIKALQEKATLLRGKLAKISGLSVFQFEKLQELLELKETRPLTDAEIDDMSILLQEKEMSRMSMRDRGRLSALYSELSKLQSKVATDYYLDQVNEKIQQIKFNNSDMTSVLFKELNNKTVDLLLQPNLVNPLRQVSSEFKAWFDANHIEVKAFDEQSQETTKYQRLFAWNRNVPAKEFVKNTTLSTGEIIPGIPKRHFFYSSVKKEYRTQKVVGTTVDNRGYWLPKTVQQGAIDDKYINQDYAALKRDKPAEFKALESLTKVHLENQVGANKSAKLYLEIPRFRKQNLEYLQTTDLAQDAKGKVNSVVSAAKAFKSQFVGAADDAEDGFNFNQESFDLVSADMFDHEVSGIPVSGKYRLDVDQVSLDVVGSMVRYMMSVERQKKLIEINPQVKALQKVLSDPRNAIKDMGKINRSAYIYRGIISPITKTGKSVRSKAIDNLIEREFQGIKFTGLGSESTTAQKISSTLFGLASFRFFAGNIPSALKNRFGAIIQNNIEAIGGTNFSGADYAKGKLKGLQVTSEISSQIYSKTPKSLNVQIVEVFDPVQGRFQQKAADIGSRTWLRDLAEGSVLFSPRKLLELEGSMEFFFSMMHGQKVEITENGQTRKIDYANAWEVVDGQLTLKKGVDKSWDKSGANFKLFVNKTHDLMNKLQGTYAQFDQPEAQRYLAFRYVSFLRRYFTSMFMHRFGHRRFNAAGAEISAGYYREFGNFIVSFFRGLHEGSFYYTESEKSGAFKTLAEVGQLVALSLIATFAFGFDLDDEDKYEKLRQRSGAAPFPGVADSEYEFDFGGWLMNHALYQTLLVHAENRQFVPLPTIVYKGTQFGFGLNDYANLTEGGSIVTGPTFGAYASIINDVVQLAGDDDRAFYGRDMGPFEFQQKEEAKVLNHLAKLVGVKGTTVDPTEGVKTFISVEARNK